MSGDRTPISRVLTFPEHAAVRRAETNRSTEALEDERMDISLLPSFYFPPCFPLGVLEVNSRFTGRFFCTEPITVNGDGSTYGGGLLLQVTGGQTSSPRSLLSRSDASSASCHFHRLLFSFAISLPPVSPRLAPSGGHAGVPSEEAG